VRVHALVDNLAAARLAVESGATVVQLRVKAPTETVVAAGEGFRDLGATFVVNDDVDAALALGADGVHLGQGDPGERVPGLLLGRSVATVEQALAADADYVGAGPVWATPSKTDAEPPIGLEGLRAICAAVDVPVIAIGGVDASTAGACIEAGAFGVAAIRAAADPALRRAVDAALAGR
jgi:thiamine-phosphate pyrophosphorylase